LPCHCRRRILLFPCDIRADSSEIIIVSDSKEISIKERSLYARFDWSLEKDVRNLVITISRVIGCPNDSGQ